MRGITQHEVQIALNSARLSPVAITYQNPQLQQVSVPFTPRPKKK